MELAVASTELMLARLAGSLRWEEAAEEYMNE